VADLFIDTSGFYALLVRGDTAHSDASEIIGSLRDSRAGAITTDYIIDECLTLFKARGVAQICERFLSMFRDSRAMRVEYIGAERFERAKLFYMKHIDHSYSFTDCTSFIVMNSFKLNEALTTDTHFTEAGFKALLKR